MLAPYNCACIVVNAIGRERADLGNAAVEERARGVLIDGGPLLLSHTVTAQHDRPIASTIDEGTVSSRWGTLRISRGHSARWSRLRKSWLLKASHSHGE